jgi:hypothetical protein
MEEPEMIGKQVKKILDMTGEAYHDHAALSRSDALTILRAGTRTAKWNREHPQPRSQPALEFGSMFHTAMEGISELERKYDIEPSGDKRTKAVKEAIEEARLAFPDKTLVPEAQYLQVLRMAEAVQEHPRVQELLLGNRVEREVSLFGECCGVGVKARPDAVLPDLDLIIDWKTTQDGSRDGFDRSVLQYGYWLQPTWYTSLANVHYMRPMNMIFVCVEKSEPYNVSLFCLDDGWNRYARSKMQDACVQWANSLANDVWEAYSEEVQTLQAPKWIAESVGVRV